MPHRLPPRMHPMQHTGLCHGAVGLEHSRNGCRAPIADALSVEIQLGIEIALRENGRHEVWTDTCLLPLVHCGQRLGDSGHLLGARHCQ